MPKEIFILGKPNVGKSSLFNSLIGKQLALVQNEPGLTVDVRKKKVIFFEKEYYLYDTAGISDEDSDLNIKIKSITFKNISQSALVLFIIDGKEGINKEDYFIVDLLRKIRNRIILLVNKCEGKINPFVIEDCFKFGLGRPFKVSAAHNQGIQNLKIYINEIFASKEVTFSSKKENPLSNSIAIVGQTNSGKSTLLNSLVRQEISVTNEKPNLTRDPVESKLTIDNLVFRIFDTAGISVSSGKKDELQKISEYESNRKIRLSEIILILLDINNYWEKKNKKLIDRVLREKRTTIIVINKIDMKKHFSKKFIKEKIFELLPDTTGMPIYFISAKKKIGISQLREGIRDIHGSLDIRISTSSLNKWLEKAIKLLPPALHKGREVKLKYISQVNTKPPKFKIFSNFPDAIMKNYKRYLNKELKKKL